MKTRNNLAHLGLTCLAATTVSHAASTRRIDDLVEAGKKATLIGRMDVLPGAPLGNKLAAKIEVKVADGTLFNSDVAALIDTDITGAGTLRQ